MIKTNYDTVPDHQDKMARKTSDQSESIKETNKLKSNSNHAPGICIVDKDLNVIFCNKQFSNLYKLPDEITIPGTPYPKILEHKINSGSFKDKDIETPINLLKAITEKTSPSLQIQTLKDKNILISIEPMPHGGWTETHTEFKEYPTAINDKENVFLKAFQMSPTAYAIASPEEGTHFDVNDKWIELLGYSRKEALENSAVSLGIWADPNERIHFVENLKEHNSVKDFKTKFCKKNGEIIDVLVSGEYGSLNGKPMLFNIYQDITEKNLRKKLYAERRRAKNLTKSIAFLANQSDNLERTLTYSLGEICNYTGWQIGHISTNINEENCPGILQNCWHVKDTNYLSFKDNENDFSRSENQDEFALEIEELRHNSWIKYITASSKNRRINNAHNFGLNSAIAIPIKIKDDVVARLEFFSDEEITFSSLFEETLREITNHLSRVIERSITQSKLIAHSDQLEELVAARTAEVKQKAWELELALSKEKELNTLQSQFVSMASHEFRTPLTIIDSSAQIMMTKGDKITKEIILTRGNKIRGAVKRMLQLMESTFMAAKMQEGKIAIKLGTCDIKKVINNACQLQKDINNKHNINCEFSDLPPSITADESALDQVLTNLLTNAIKYSPNNTDINVRAQTDKNNIIMSVEDKGLGIDEKDLPKMFQRFFRAKTSTGIAGTGIGLNLVKMLVEMHEGTIEVQSKINKGSTFTVRLPITGPSNGERLKSNL